MSEMRSSIILEEIDSSTRCIVNTFRVATNHISLTEGLLSKFSRVNKENCLLEVSLDERNILSKIVSDANFATANDWFLRPFSDADKLSYLSHTGRELAMLLAGLKPLAYFSVPVSDGLHSITDQPFQDFVDSGILSRHDETYFLTVMTGQQIEMRRICFTTAGNEWRVLALAYVYAAIENTGANPATYWLEGKLLGYTDEQNREYLRTISE